MLERWLLLWYGVTGFIHFPAHRASEELLCPRASSRGDFPTVTQVLFPPFGDEEKGMYDLNYAMSPI
jgi:hypothetical protein